MASSNASKVVIYAALAGNILVAVSKFGAAMWTGSSAMLSEAVHSLVDTANQLLMLYGIHRASAPPDPQHPLGYGRELYFWSFIVALLMFSLGAGLSFYEGISHIVEPAAIIDPNINYVVLTLSLVFEGASWAIATREFNKHRGELGYVEAATRSRDPTLFLVLFEDTAAIIGIAIALLGTIAAEWMQAPELDGVASLGIATVLAVTAGFLARESKGLLIGEPAREPTRQSILKMVVEHPAVSAVGRLITVHLAPQQIVAAMDVDFEDDLRASDVERVAESLETLVKRRHPEVVSLFVSPKKRNPDQKGSACSSPDALFPTSGYVRPVQTHAGDGQFG